LFKQLGADGYYKIYPDEAPQGYKPPEPKAATAPVQANFNVLNLPVTGGAYDGMTLRDVMQSDPEEGTRMLNEWKDGQQAEIRKQEETVSKEKHEQETEAFNFGMARAKELFNVDDASKLTDEHNRKIVILGQEVLKWQRETGRQSLSWEDAYKLMKHDEIVKNAVEKAKNETFKSLQKSGPVSIDTGTGGNAQPSGWDEVARMTPDALEKHIDNLSDKDVSKFLKDAPKAVRDKHPSMPWK
jgi:hypothetical protein